MEKRPDALDRAVEEITAKCLADPAGYGRRLLERNQQWMIDNPCKAKFEDLPCIDFENEQKEL